MLGCSPPYPVFIFHCFWVNLSSRYILQTWHRLFFVATSALRSGAIPPYSLWSKTSYFHRLLPGTFNNQLLMVVSLGWLQITMKNGEMHQTSIHLTLVVVPGDPLLDDFPIFHGNTQTTLSLTYQTMYLKLYSMISYIPIPLKTLKLTTTMIWPELSLHHTELLMWVDSNFFVGIAFRAEVAAHPNERTCDFWMEITLDTLETKI